MLKHAVIASIAIATAGCASLPEGWPKCGMQTQSTWSRGCDGRALDAALRHLGFETRLAFVEWAASRQEGNVPLKPNF